MAKSFLTSKQLEVLKLRTQGYTQEEIAKKLGSTRENITITERRAKDNVERARATIEAFEMLEPVEMHVESGMDVFEIPRMIFKEADRHGIKILYNTTSLVGIIRRKLGEKIIGNKVYEAFTVLILRSGKVNFKT
ncbi:MAG: Tfx family DNA-binding protein [Candidatus Hydrothermarchaeota archaeon]|nr:Tfx family DNA-binding protein [Candidatus Hydrothermarchaeota archaeon]